MSNQQIEIRRKVGWTNLQNALIWDSRVSKAARFALIAMLSLPSDWDYSVRGMAAKMDVSKDTMLKYIRELEEAGYLLREPQAHDKGRFSKSRYVLTDTPYDFGVSGVDLMDETCPNFSDTKKSPPKNSPQQNNIKQNTKQQISPKAPQGGRRSREPKKQPDWKPERFNKFWDFYPRGESKQTAIRAWDKLQPSDELIDTMAQALKRQVASEGWRQGIGIPYASTWLNQRRWEDEIKAPAAGQASAGTGRVVEEEGAYYL